MIRYSVLEPSAHFAVKRCEVVILIGMLIEIQSRTSESKIDERYLLE